MPLKHVKLLLEVAQIPEPHGGVQTARGEEELAVRVEGQAVDVHVVRVLHLASRGTGNEGGEARRGARDAVVE